MRRKLLNKLTDHLAKKSFTIFTGARQLGKTTLLQQLHSDLLEAGEFAYYLSFEDGMVLQEINEHPGKFFSLLVALRRQMGNEYT